MIERDKNRKPTIGKAARARGCFRARFFFFDETGQRRSGSGYGSTPAEAQADARDRWWAAVRGVRDRIAGRVAPARPARVTFAQLVEQAIPTLRVRQRERQVRPDDPRRAAYCSAVVAARHPGAAALGDVAGIDGARLEPIDGLALGFPCTDISAAGSGRGLDGDRSGLWHHVPRILAEMAPNARPAWIIIENGGLLPRRGLSVVLHDLAQLGYDAGWQVIGAVGVGAPHLRERCAVVARRDGRVLSVEWVEWLMGAKGVCPRPLEAR